MKALQRGFSTFLRRRRAQQHFGPNEIAHEAPLPGWLRLWRCDVNPFNRLLTVSALLSFLSADRKATAVIAAMVALSTVTAPTPDGRVALNVPGGAAQGRRLRIKGMGLSGQVASDLYAVRSIALPPSVSASEKEAYGAFARAFASCNLRSPLEA